MLVMLCTGATFVKKNSCLVARIASFVTAGLHLVASRILGPYPSKHIELDLGHVISHSSQLLKYVSNIEIFQSHAVVEMWHPQTTSYEV